ncbi:MAG TPA: hypothetical protein VE053_09960 [Allosphingosinicella sp.]|nr:hypothetical protein [Allosphingosinicella sp.]
MSIELRPVRLGLAAGAAGERVMDLLNNFDASNWLIDHPLAASLSGETTFVAVLAILGWRTLAIDQAGFGRPPLPAGG